MLSNRARFALFDIRDNLRLAQEFVVGLSLETFKADTLTYCGARAAGSVSPSPLAFACSKT